MDMTSPPRVKKKKRKVISFLHCTINLIYFAYYFSKAKLSSFFSSLQPPKPKPARRAPQPAKPSDHYRLNLGNIPFVVGQVRVSGFEAVIKSFLFPTSIPGF